MSDFTTLPSATHTLPSDSLRKFALAGRAVFTVVSERTGARFTFKVTAKPIDGGKTLHCVKVLTGADNTSDFTYLGTIFEGSSYRHGRNSRIGTDAPSAKAAQWLFSRVLTGKPVEQASVHHEGRCGRCGRALTVPSSIESGFGPECVGKI